MQFLLQRVFNISDEKRIRKADTIMSSILTLFDLATDTNTAIRLMAYNGEYACNYNCPLVLALMLLSFLIYNVMTQTIYIWQRYDGNSNRRIYTLLSVVGLAPIVIAYDFWDDIENDNKYIRFFIIRWMETTNEALPAATLQIVIILFFSEQAFTLNTNLSFTIILILISIALSLWSVGNGTRRYVAFVGGFKKPKWYYWSLALYTATDIFNRSLLIALFFVTVLDVHNFDGYIIVICLVVIIHQIVFFIINHQRNIKNGKDDGCLGNIIQSHFIPFAIFIAFYIILPSSVIFLRNFHVETAKISFYVTWINGIIIMSAAFIFWLVRVVIYNDGVSNNYFAAAIYLFCINLIPFILVLYGRNKEGPESEGEHKGFTISFADLQRTAKQEQEQRAKRQEKIEKNKQKQKELEEERKKKKAEEIKKKDEKMTQKMKQETEKKEREKQEKLEERNRKLMEREKRLKMEMEMGAKKSYEIRKEKEEKKKRKKQRDSYTLAAMSSLMVANYKKNDNQTDDVIIHVDHNDNNDDEKVQSDDDLDKSALDPTKKSKILRGKKKSFKTDKKDTNSVKETDIKKHRKRSSKIIESDSEAVDVKEDDIMTDNVKPKRKHKKSSSKIEKSDDDKRKHKKSSSNISNNKKHRKTSSKLYRIGEMTNERNQEHVMMKIHDDDVK